MDEQRLELKVGILALVALAAAVALIVALSGIATGRSFTFNADFNYAGGLPAGAQVKIAGVKVGRVRSVELRPDAKDRNGLPAPVRLVVDIDPKAAVALHADAEATVGAQGALGESYLEILPGTNAAPLVENATIEGLGPPRLDLILARLFSFLNDSTSNDAIRTFLVQLGNLAHAMNGVLEADRPQIEKLLQGLGDLIANTQQTMNYAKSTTRSASEMLGSPEAKQMLADLSETAKAARTELPGLLTDTHAMVTDLQKTTGKLTPEDMDHVKEMIARYDSLGGQLQTVSKRADDLLADIQNGKGTVGKMVKNPVIFDDLKALLEDIKAHPWRLVWKQ